MEYKDFVVGAAIGFPTYLFRAASFPFVIPTAVRRSANDQDCLSSRLDLGIIGSRTRVAGEIVGGALGWLSGAGALAYSVYRSGFEVMDGNYAPAVTAASVLALTNIISGVVEYKRRHISAIENVEAAERRYEINRAATRASIARDERARKTRISS